jgi:DNA replication licensing factor MCM4
VEPDRCPRAQCAMKFSMQMVHNRCSFSNRQQVKMQETPDEMPEGETPHTVNMCLFDDMVDIAKPGDRVQVRGPKQETALVNGPAS